jgi:radical SAM/Cys-rich protein
MIAESQLKTLSDIQRPSFQSKLKEHDLAPLKTGPLEILQVNLGYMCNQTCNHCHVDAGPDRTEKMSKENLQLIVDIVLREEIKSVDITGGAPEMHPHFRWFVEMVRPHVEEVIVRSNLTFLVQNKKTRELPEFFRKQKVRIISSLPCYTKSNVEGQRGIGVFEKSLEALKTLNEVGFGVDLKLDLVYNPGGASLPGDQAGLEEDYKRVLGEEYDIHFNELFTITNMPISRFLEFLVASDRLDSYMDTLIQSFNPATVEGLMCRNNLSVDWQGKLYDCDFNQMLLIPTVHEEMTLANFNLALLEGRNIRTHQHCYGCTAGAGSSCQGVLN